MHVSTIDSPAISKQKTLSQQVFERLQTDIVKGVLPSGSKLSESELSTNYGAVSYTHLTLPTTPYV